MMRRSLALLAAVVAVSGAARAGDITYPGLAAATTVQDLDLIATWRASGPLTKVQASVLEAYMQSKLNPVYLQIGNSLSELSTNAATARSNLGLGSAALANTGTSGTALCQLNSNCTWTGTEAFNGKVTVGASAAAGAMLNLAPGTAPSSPVNGDVWTTSAGEFERVNGITQQVAYLTSNVASATNATNATNATTASNANALGGVAPSVYARQDTANTYSALQTFSAGASTPTINGFPAVQPGTINVAGGTCGSTTGLDLGGPGAGQFHLTSACAVNGTLEIQFSVAAPHGWVCVLQDGNNSSVRLSQNFFSTSACIVVVLGAATGSSDAILFTATPF